MVLWLWHTGKQDVYQNTPLHYLASDMWPNEELLKKVREREEGEAVRKSRNELGYTPEDLCSGEIGVIGIIIVVENWGL